MSELLLPVGNMQMCLAAVHHGADAIYVGVPFFNARGRSADLSFEELKEMIDLCHLYGVKVNLAFNVVIFQNEFPKVIKVLKQILPMGPDALIVQDLGLASLIRKIAPEQRIHASTQMTVTNADAIKLLEDLKIDRFVLGRENSLKEIKLIREATDKELEVFVHGALCVAYSGQCFTSESLGGRSANRGQCAQSCRLPYELYVDGEKKDTGDKSYFVSPKDLMGLEEINALQEAGVDSFKVEGRLKTPEYVASAAKNYREVLDGNPLDLSRRSQELATNYSRGFFSGWLNGVDHQNLVDGTYSAHRGILIGEVKEIKKNRVIISSDRKLETQQGLLFVGREELGGKIIGVQKIGTHYEVQLLKIPSINTGDKVYLNSDETLSLELKKSWTQKSEMKKIPLSLSVSGAAGKPLVVRVKDPEGRVVSVDSKVILEAATARPLNKDFAKEELFSLGNTAYRGGIFTWEVSGDVFLHQRELKEVRRSFVEAMNLKRILRERIINEISLPDLSRSPSLEDPRLTILLRTRSQVDLFLHDPEIKSIKDSIEQIVLDFEFGKHYEESLGLLRENGYRVGISTTRILKPSEYYNLNLLIRLKPDFILVRNLGALSYLRERSEIILIGDFSFNVTNSYSLNYLSSKGLKTVNLSYDLNEEQIRNLVRESDPSKVEVTLHQYMPEFHMEHCVFAAFLSKGHSFKDCGKPCEKHEVKLKDPYGNFHFLKADHECRNTFFRATPQSASFLVESLKDLGVRHFRLEALSENSSELKIKIMAYLKLLRGEISPESALDELQIQEAYGLGMGQLQERDAYRDRKKE
jgi:U32 family peptidase